MTENSLLEELTKFVIKWNGSEYNFNGLDKKSTIHDLKVLIEEQTNVLVARQKILGLSVNGRPAGNDVSLGDIKIKDNAKIMMMGTCEAVIADTNDIPDNLEVMVDFDDGKVISDYIPYHKREEEMYKVNRRIKNYKIDVLQPPRPGKKLLVLDIDYTIFDHKSTAERGVELMRPYLHQFLESAYADYDIAIWSATGMIWIKAKMKELMMMNSDKFKISFLVDSEAMIKIYTGTKYGFIRAKPLAVIWGIFDNVYNRHNTIMFDDIRHNFLMNPANGLKIRPFRNANQNRDTDDELVKLGVYLQKISVVEDFLTLNHRHWESYNSSDAQVAPKKVKK